MPLPGDAVIPNPYIAVVGESCPSKAWCSDRPLRKFPGAARPPGKICWGVDCRESTVATQCGVGSGSVGSSCLSGGGVVRRRRELPETRQAR